jgi:putrescine aminotransferase
LASGSAAGLRGLLDDDDRVAEVRGDGAVWAVGLADGVSAPRVRDGMLARGVIPRPIGESTVAFCPPLVIGDDDVDRCAQALGDALKDV